MKLTQQEFINVIKLFDLPTVRVPYNDSVTFRNNGIDSCVITTLPPSLNQSKKIEETYNIAGNHKKGNMLRL